MKKKFLISAILILALLVGSILWYTRPMTLRQLCPDVDLSQCSSISVYYEVMPSGGRSEKLVLEPDDPAFDSLLKELQDRTFSRSLISLLPWVDSQSAQPEDGDFSWELMLTFDNPDTASDGTEQLSTQVQLYNFFGSLSLNHMRANHTWYMTTSDQEAWVSQVMDIITSAIS